MSPSLMSGSLHITTWLGPRLRAGSSSATEGSGVGENQPPWAGCVGSRMSIACNPPECQESNATFRSTVGLCEPYLVNSSVPAPSPNRPALPLTACLILELL